MIIDFLGRVNNTPLSPRQALIPLFEAIVNSIHAIDEANRKDGQITVIVTRDTDSMLIRDDEQMHIAPITGFNVIDNGIGFNVDNYASFSTSDTQKKRSMGGKGVGRFLWLKAFDQVTVNSVFQENGQLMERTFEFFLSNDPIKNHQCTSVSNGTTFTTQVSLVGLKPLFSEFIPKKLDVLAYRIVEHCLEYFVLGTVPVILLQDDNETINLLDMYNGMVSGDAKTECQIGEYKFTLFHFILKARSGMLNKLNYCAIHRVVDHKNLDSKTIPNLPARIPASDGDLELIYMGYLSSPFLDTHVNQQRTGFDICLEEQFKFLGELSWNEIEAKALELVRDYLQPITEPIKAEKQKQVEEFVREDAPQYRSVLKFRPDAIDKISPNIQPDKLDLELYKVQKQWEIDLRETANEIIGNPVSAFSDNGQDVQEKYICFLEEWNENGKAALAKYVVHRKITLALLEKHMERSENGGYARERTIHQLIFPLKKTSDDINYEQQNLWIIDEKLSFHRYLASDLEFRQLEILESNDLDRPDLLIFDNAIAMVEDEPINGITIFEFKRPMRGDSNPVSQMYEYVRKIRSGKAKTNHDRPIVIRAETPFYCYAICDLPLPLRNELENMGMQITPDNEGYFMYNLNLRAYVEVLSYDKLLRDAKQRNRVLFEKLNITG